MKELEEMKRAKSYVDQLAKGIHPLTGEGMGEDTVLNQVEMARCFFFISEMLGKAMCKEGEESLVEGEKPSQTESKPEKEDTEEEVLCTKRVYRHFKGKLYYVHELVTHTETREEMVSYQALYPPYGMFVRPKPMFVEEVDVNRVDNPLKQRRRFELFHPTTEETK